MNLKVKKIPPNKKAQPVTSEGLYSASQKVQPIVISQVKPAGQQGQEVFIVVKHTDGCPMRAEVKIVASPENSVVRIESVRRDVKKIMTAIEVVNRRIENDEQDRNRLLSKCSD